MGLGIGAVQNILELNNLGYFKNSNSTIEIGSQQLHLNFVDLKKLFETAGLKDDLNKPFEDKSKFNKYDIVTDFGSCEHVYNIGECYKTVHNLAKKDGYIIIAQATLKGNGYFKFDQSFLINEWKSILQVNSSNHSLKLYISYIMLQSNII